MNPEQHLRSRAHVGQTMTCPFCQRNFATATGMTHHLEYSYCPNASHLTRDDIYRFARSRDPQGTYTKKPIGWTSSPTYEATSKAWNGYAWECYFCHRKFSSLAGLNQHLNSPTREAPRPDHPPASLAES